MALVQDAITFLKRYNLHNANSRNNAPVIKNKAATPLCPLSTKPAPLIQPLKEKMTVNYWFSLDKFNEFFAFF